MTGRRGSGFEKTHALVAVAAAVTRLGATTKTAVEALIATGSGMEHQHHGRPPFGCISVLLRGGGGGSRKGHGG